MTSRFLLRNSLVRARVPANLRRKADWSHAGRLQELLGKGSHLDERDSLVASLIFFVTTILPFTGNEVEGALKVIGQYVHGTTSVAVPPIGCFADLTSSCLGDLNPVDQSSVWLRSCSSRSPPSTNSPRSISSWALRSSASCFGVGEKSSDSGTTTVTLAPSSASIAE